MKVKEYVLKYDLTKSKKVNHRELVGDLTADLYALLEEEGGRKNFIGLSSAIYAFRVKFDAVNKCAVADLTKLWKHFFAPIIAKLREDLFSAKMQKTRDKQAKGKKMYKDFPTF
jgi:hypothetical protein